MKIIKHQTGIGVLFLLALTACEPEKTPQGKASTKPRIFTPAAESDSATTEVPAPAQNPVSAARPARPFEKPDLKKLDKITPNQEAKRALTTDAYKAAKMSLPDFGAYMQSRIPYYKNKGELYFQNDIVQIKIDEKEMQIRTMKGTLHYPMR